MSGSYKDLIFTKFPEDLDTFYEYTNITAEDGGKIKMYREALERGDYDGAYNILKQIPMAARKLVKAEDLNRMSQAIQALERFYGTDVYDYIQYKQREWESVLEAFKYSGVWEETKTYKENNLVAYPDLESKLVYIATKNVPMGVKPTDTSYWRPMTIQGERGLSGYGLAYRGAWSVGVQYRAQEAVTYDGALWMSNMSTIGQAPGTSRSWSFIMSLEATSYPIQPTKPSHQKAGGLWFNTNETDTGYYHLSPLSNPATAKDIAKGKQAYGANGEVIVGTGTGSGGGSVNWNEPSNMRWNEGEGV